MRWTVLRQEKLIHFLSQRMEESVSKRRIKQWLELGQCSVNGVTERFSSRQLKQGDVVSFRVPNKMQKHERKKTSRICFEDETLLIYDKPPGISVEDLEAQMGASLVHRLDKDTSGLLIFAKTKATKEAMERAFRERLVEKMYLALVDGIPPADRGKCRDRLKKEGTMVKASPQGLSAETDWVLRRKGKRASLIVCYPKTGRTHQVRVHLLGLRCPILGDYTYNRIWKSPLRPQRHLLHAAALSFRHPETQASIQLSRDLPRDFQLFLEKAFGVQGEFDERPRF